jgi:dimeric dUTPase (all-alpha-NTP-PPase superfamily)
MNLSKLFDMQRVLDERIVKEKGLKGKDLLPMKILALQVELGELANEWRRFKFWSNDQEPKRIAFKAQKKDGKPSAAIRYDPLLEEYVDCLHFILSIGLECGYEDSIPALKRNFFNYCCEDITTQFNKTMNVVGNFGTFEKTEANYMRIVMMFSGLGKMLGFTSEQIETAYLEKNKVNHKRQENGY